MIETAMDDGWSPKLISELLVRDHPDDKLARVSHETIYKCLYVQTRGQLRADLHKCLSTKRAARKPHRSVTRAGVYPPGSVFTIRDRPAEAADRAVPGHWEGDLIMGAGNTSAIGTLVERSTRFTILLHLPADHTAESVATAMIGAMSELPAHLRRTITWDRGSEMANWRTIDLQLQAPVYFCDPHSPWQRGTNESIYWCTVLEPDGFDGSRPGELLGDSENTCREWPSVDLSTAARGKSPDRCDLIEAC